MPRNARAIASVSAESERRGSGDDAWPSSAAYHLLSFVNATRTRNGCT